MQTPGTAACFLFPVCLAPRLLEAGMTGVAMRLGELSMPVRDVVVHPGYEGAEQQETARQRNDIGTHAPSLAARSC